MTGHLNPAPPLHLDILSFIFFESYFMCHILCVQEVVNSIYIMSYYIKWVTTSWTYSICPFLWVHVLYIFFLSMNSCPIYIATNYNKMYLDFLNIQFKLWIKWYLHKYFFGGGGKSQIWLKLVNSCYYIEFNLIEFSSRYW